MSNLRSITDGRLKETTFEHDGYNRVWKVNYPGTPSPLEQLTYDGAGRLRTRTDRKGVTTTFTHDDLGRLERKAYSGGPSTPDTVFTYDAGTDQKGRLTSASNASGTLAWTYDLGGQVRSEVATRNGSSSSVAYTYDAAGNRETLTLDGIATLQYTYDDGGLPEMIRRLPVGAGDYVIAHDEASRRKSLTFPTTPVVTQTVYAYDGRSRLSGITTSYGASVRTEFTYPLYDPVDNRLERGGATDPAETYFYDDLYRLQWVKRGIPFTETYSYDDVGNRLSSIAYPSPPWSYGDRNELLSNGPPGGAVQMGYDLNGNLISKIEPPPKSTAWIYEWNAENQLTRVLLGGTQVAAYQYDPLGRRVSRTAGNDSASWTYDAEDILRENALAPLGGDPERPDYVPVTRLFVHGPGIDEPLGIEASAELGYYHVGYYHADGLGSIVRNTNAAGTAEESGRYTAFGVLEAGVPGYSFTGREWDSTVGLHYYRARYYDPKIGRFISEDPIGFSGGINFFTYVLNNPVNSTDPSGLDLNICHRQTTGVPNRLRTPHAVVFSTKSGKGHGFGPREGEIPLPGLPVPGQIFPEDPYDPNGKPKPGFQCTTRSKNSCIEDCYNEELPFQQAAPPNYVIAPRWMGGNVCTDWPQDMITRCTLKCAGKQ